MDCYSILMNREWQVIRKSIISKLLSGSLLNEIFGPIVYQFLTTLQNRPLSIISMLLEKIVPQEHNLLNSRVTYLLFLRFERSFTQKETNSHSQ